MCRFWKSARPRSQTSWRSFNISRRSHWSGGRSWSGRWRWLRERPRGKRRRESSTNWPHGLSWRNRWKRSWEGRLNREEKAHHMFRIVRTSERGRVEAWDICEWGWEKEQRGMYFLSHLELWEQLREEVWRREVHLSEEEKKIMESN